MKTARPLVTGALTFIQRKSTHITQEYLTVSAYSMYKHYHIFFTVTEDQREVE